MQTTKNLAKSLRKRYGDHHWTEAESEQVVDDVVDLITQALETGEDVRLTGFGTLSVSTRKQGSTLFGKPNPNAGKIFRNVTFRDSAQLRQRLNR